MVKINVQIVFAEPQRQWLSEMSVMRGCSADDLIKQSGFLHEIPALQGLELDELSLGVYSQKVGVDYLLKEGDRLEIYRPLKADPKEVRRQLALLGKTMGKTKAKVAPTPSEQ